MRNLRVLLTLVSCVGVLCLAVGCSDDSTPKADKGALDMGADVRTGDVGVDIQVEIGLGDTGVDLGVDAPLSDQGQQDDAGPDQGQQDDAGSDQQIDSPQTDLARDMMPGGEGGVPPAGGTCATAQEVTLINDSAIVTGDISLFKDEFGGVNCPTMFSTTLQDGPQAYYKFQGVQDQWYRFTYNSESSDCVYLYVFTNPACTKSAIETDCQSGGATGGGFTSSCSSTSKRAYYYKAKTNGMIYVALDNASVPSNGKFTLKIDAIATPTNGTCANAKSLTFFNGKAVASGDTHETMTPDEFPGVDCSFITMTGPQAYYTFTAKANTSYEITVNHLAGYNIRFYVFGSTCTEAAISADCGSKGVSGAYSGSSISSGDSKTLIFTPPAVGTYHIAIDSSVNYAFGHFDLTVEEFPKPQNDTCATATPLTFSNGTATVSATTKGATNEGGSTIHCGGTTDFVGPQVYYSFDALAGKGYRIKLDPTFSAYLYVYTAGACGAPAVAVNLACGSAGTDGDVLGPISSPGTMLFKPVNAGKYLIAVDSSLSTRAGDFTLTVDELDPPANQTCSAATPVSFTNQKLTIQGTTAFGTDEFPGVVNCGKSSSFDGPQAYYTYNATAGHNYWVQLNSSFDNAYLYVFSGACTGSNIQTSCSSSTNGGVLGPVNSSSKAMYLTAPTSGAFTLAVDSDLTTSNDEFGDFTVNIEEFSTATNATCATAQQITLVQNSAQVTGFTVGTADEFAGAIKCGGSSAFAAGQTYYKVDLTAGLEYTFTLSADFDARAYYFRGGTNCQATAIETDCSSTTVGDGGLLSLTAGGQESVTFIPTVSQTYYIAIDGVAAGDVGRYQLDVTAFVIPTITVPTTGLTLDFESGNGGLAAKGDWQWGQINFQSSSCSGAAPPNNQGHVPTQSGMWGTVLNGCYQNRGNNQGSCSSGSSDKSDDSILTFNLAIPAGWTTAKLEWWEFADVFISFDWAEVWVDGKLDTATQICSGSSSAKKWEKKSIDLSAYVGKTVNISFHFMASSVVAYPGWYIDEISVTQ